MSTQREWKPGDVAMVTALNKPEPYRAYYDGETWREYGQRSRCVNSPKTHRPLAVIDPEDVEQVYRLVDLVIAHGYMLDPNRLSDLAAALREFADPPKPEEPTGLGAVVEDADGEWWVRLNHNPSTDDPWKPYGSRDRRHPYADINAVRVLSEGVTP